MKIIAVDFDGTISNYDGFQGKGVFGSPIPGVVSCLSSLRNIGHEISINTTRKEIDKIEIYLKRNKIPYDHINFSPKNYLYDLSPSKIQADVYVDDRALKFEGKWDEEFFNKIINFNVWWKNE